MRASSTSATPAGPVNEPPVIFCTAGRTTSTASSTSLLVASTGTGDRPYVRGCNTTRFLETFRNGQPSAVAVDLIALMDALKIEGDLAGFDWGRGLPASLRRFGQTLQGHGIP